jgi:hypothetical protein
MTKTRTRHGLNAAMTRIKLRGLSAIDMRTVAARDLIAWRQELLNALGGNDNVSPQKWALIDLAVRTKALIDHCDAFLLAEPSIINRRRKALLPLVAQRQTLCDSLSRLLSQIGLERVARSSAGETYEVKFINGRPVAMSEQPKSEATE